MTLVILLLSYVFLNPEYFCVFYFLAQLMKIIGYLRSDAYFTISIKTAP